MKQITLFSDGSSLGNPGPGGYGVILRYKEHEKELSDGYALTTNNRMELLGVITGLQALKEACEVNIITDSQYVINGMTKWIYGWKKKNWTNSANKPVLNKDLWQTLDSLVIKHKVTWTWVKGHDGHEENERCDVLAKNAASQPNLKEDKGYQPE